MGHLILVRHGESDQHVSNLTGGWSDTHLTELGRRQAEATGHGLKGLLAGEAPLLRSSDLARARETADILGAALGVQPTFHEGLRELNNGAAAGLALEAARAIELPMTHPTLDWVPYPGAESWRMMADRIFAFLEGLQDATSRMTVIVSHGNAGIPVIHWWLGLPPHSKISYELAPCSITRLGINSFGERTIIKLNDTAHLDAIAATD